MRINIYTTAAIPHIGGMSTNIENTFSALVARGYDVRVYSRRRRNLTSGGSSANGQFVSIAKLFLRIAIASRFRFTRNADVHVFHDPVAILFARRREMKILFVHGELANEMAALGLCRVGDRLYRFYKAIETSAYTRSDRIICVDSRIRDYVHKCGFAATVMHNFVQPSSAADSGSRLSPPIKCVIARRFVEKSGIVHALQALDIVRANNIRIICKIYGSGVLKEKLMADYPHDDNIFMGDHPNSQVRESQSKSTFALVPSIPIGDYAEATSFSALEACADGALLIASDLGGLREMFEGDRGVVLVRPGSAEEIAKAMIQLIQDPSLYERERRKAKAFVEASYGIDAYLDKFTKMIDLI